MAWQTPKTDWGTNDAIRDTDLNRMESNIIAVREQNDLPFFFEVRSDFPSHAAGRAFYYSTDKRVYTSTGTAQG